MTASNIPARTADCVVQGMLRDYLMSGRLAEVIYRDGAGQICTVHDVIRDLFSRAGEDFIMLGRGNLVGIDHVLMIDGCQLTGTGD
ncbi:hypothetical protein FWJ25_03665 [Marinobacter salinexigens]|uniref:Rho-binding antiterminator n=1 Tax=Marinobacter salinexigens TaxID=2919747 RepID=A0A5B0VQJ4_9GAMM|nr:hypothetical protein [Marinobacter salinexigens]KAA1176241.1 hypothetical protein FWJ25_03665 [Marinobacter salinexigens]